MKKLMLICAAVAGIAGCTLTLDQQKATARLLGTAAAATWIGTDKPTPEDIKTMQGVVAQIQAACCTNCTESGTYTERVMPVVDTYIAAKVPAERQAMARLGAGAVLSGLDLMFAMNPEWKAKADNASSIAEAFCEGAQAGLALPADSPIIAAACGQTKVRVQLKRVK